MRRLSILIGALSLALSASGVLWSETVQAATSTNYQLSSDNQDQATINTLGSTSYTLKQSNVTWRKTNLSSTSYQIVDPGFDSNMSSSSSSSSTEGSSGGTGGGSTSHGGGRQRSMSSSATSTGSTASLNTPQKKKLRFAASPLSASPEESEIFHSAPENVVSVQTIQTASIGNLRFFDAVDPLYVTTRVHEENLNWILVILIIILSLCYLRTVLRTRGKEKKQEKKRKKNRGKQKKPVAISLLIAFALGMTSMHSEKAYAVQTAPNKHIYNGRLLDANGQAVTSAQSIRLSYWTSADSVSGDTDGSGNINTGASTYANWNEVHTVTPNANGYFSVAMGSVTTLPNLESLPIATLLSLYLQVEIKPQASANTTYELLDVDTTDTAIDRSGVLSVPFALNAETIDQREVGTSSGSIAILGTGGKFPIATVPGGTNESTFTLDNDNSESSEISLIFGGSLGKKLTYDIVSNVFRFNSSVEIQGNLTVSGTINGINVSQLQSSTGALKASSGGGLSLNIAYGNYRLNGVVTNYAGGSITMYASATNYVFFGSGGLTKNTTGFPSDESMIPLALVTTSLGSITSVVDRRVLTSDDREHDRTTTFTPSFEKATYQGDSTDNIGQLSTSHDNTNLQNFYLWTSTKSTMQDYDILVRIPISENFVRWQSTATANAMSFSYRSTSASSAQNKLDLQIYDSAGVPVTLSGSTTNLASTTWSTTQVEFTGSPTWTAGQDLLIRIKMSAKDSYQMHLGSVKLNTVNFDE